MFKFIKNVVLRSIIISAVVAGISYGSYWICKGLAWVTTNLTTLLTQLGTYVKANVGALITIIVLVTIANVVYELIAGRVKNGGSGRSKWRKKASKAEENK